MAHRRLAIGTGVPARRIGEILAGRPTVDADLRVWWCLLDGRIGDKSGFRLCGSVYRESAADAGSNWVEMTAAPREPGQGRPAPKEMETAAVPSGPHSGPWFAPALPPRKKFISRVRRTAKYAFSLVGVTLAIGMVGYHGLENMSWLDAFHQSAMLLSGMGPVVDLKTTAGKLFDGVYALFCGVVLLAATGLLFAPVLHRLLHRFHIEDSGGPRSGK